MIQLRVKHWERTNFREQKKKQWDDYLTQRLKHTRKRTKKAKLMHRIFKLLSCQLFQSQSGRILHQNRVSMMMMMLLLPLCTHTHTISNKKSWLTGCNTQSSRFVPAMMARVPKFIYIDTYIRLVQVLFFFSCSMAITCKSVSRTKRY